MKLLLLLLAPIALLYSCKQASAPADLIDSSSNIILTKTVKKKESNDKGVVEFFNVFKNKYLEIDLNTYYNKDNQECYFIAEKKIGDSTIVAEDSNTSTMHVVNEKGELLKFKNNDEFLSYIHQRGYQLIKQSKFRDKVKYKFKRRG